MFLKAAGGLISFFHIIINFVRVLTSHLHLQEGEWVLTQYIKYADDSVTKEANK
jgi:hypothetical protein